MSVTIDELQVETQEPPAPASAATHAAAPANELDLRAKLEVLRERELRLQAD